MPKVLSVVERGWRGPRQCSLALAARGVTVLHLIKGALGPDVRALVQPAAGVALRDVPRPLFRPVLWGLLAWWALARNLRWAVFDNERTLREASRLCRWAGIQPVLLRQSASGYELLVGGVAAPLEQVFQLT